MKRVFSIIIMLLIVLTISGCSNDKSISSTTEDKDSNQINDVETKRYDIDDIYNKLKEFDFNNMRLVDLNYNQINETTIIVWEQAFGSRELLTDQSGKSTQRILCYTMEDSTQMLIVLGSISIENSNVNDMVTLYSDSLKAIGLPENNEINISNHIDSRVFLLGNIVINTVGINLNNNLDELSVITFNEELVKLLNDI